MINLNFNAPTHINNFRYWCQKVLPIVYDDSLSYYELLCKVIDYLNKVIDETNKIGEDVTELYNTFKQLKEYVDNYFKNLDVQEEINKKLDEMAKDGTLQTLLVGVFVRSESDFDQNNTVFTLINDITITKPISVFKQNVYINLNGYTITLSDNYSEDYIFTYDDTNESHGQKKLYNGKINMNKKNAYVIKSGLSWRTIIEDLIVDNCVQGFWGYINNGGGAECRISKLTLYHADNYDNNYGLTIMFGDSVINEVYCIFFKGGILNARGSSNFYNNCHVWGYPKSADNYSDNLVMNHGFVTVINGNRFIGCYADSIEPKDITLEASYNNGGIGFICLSSNVSFIDCYSATHASSNNDKHIGFAFYDTSPITGLSNYEYDCKIINCFINTQNEKYYKAVPYYDEKGNANIVNSFMNSEPTVLRSMYIPLNKKYALKEKFIIPYIDGNGNSFATINGKYTAYYPPYYGFYFNSEDIMLSTFKEIEAYNPTAKIPLIGIFQTNLYAYDYVNKKLIKFEGTRI